MEREAPWRQSLSSKIYKLVARVDTIDQETVRNTYPKLCDGLGMVQKPYTIKLKPDAKPSLKVPRRVPLPLMGKVKKELERMEKIGVISRVEQPTDWCCGMVVAPKKNKEEVRICVDMTRLNESVCCEKFFLLSVDQTLGMLTEHFQNRMVTEVTAGIEGVVCHMDDILIWGATKEQHDTAQHDKSARLSGASTKSRSHTKHVKVYIEIAQLSPTRSTDVIVHLKSMFARHGIAETLISDNGPQFSGHDMKEFAADYGFEHLTSSPKYPQSNGEAERAIQTAKNLLKKARDPYRALLSYRATPLSNGYSRAQPHVAFAPLYPPCQSLLPALLDLQQLCHKEWRKRGMDAESFNKRHRARDLEKLLPGDHVWISDAKTQGTVISTHPSPRSYLVSSPQGTLRRNRSHLVPMPVPEPQSRSQHEHPPEVDISTETGLAFPVCRLPSAWRHRLKDECTLADDDG
ncbi:hypothetical protein L3Q82_021135, partial [Scortum barcoo]